MKNSIGLHRETATETPPSVACELFSSNAAVVDAGLFEHGPQCANHAGRADHIIDRLVHVHKVFSEQGRVMYPVSPCQAREGFSGSVIVPTNV